MLRPDIQALRAVAVAMVVAYHLWPNGVTGGYAGVDVFFVISGYLITTHLVQKPPSGVVGLLRFWSRRIRRLLPAACLVLFVTLVASRVVAPNTQWATTASHIRDAALYFVNWRLASDSVDYLAREESPTPVEHFWSLSVEEQFYIIWPILIILLIIAARAVRTPVVITIAFGLSSVVFCSLVYSVMFTDSNPSQAYFVTPTRIWELGAGGLLAVAVAGRARMRQTAGTPSRHHEGVRIGFAWVGLSAIAVTAFLYSNSTPFPSWRAALPVLGTVAVIAASVKSGPGSPARWFAFRPVQWLGDASYSIYLWHWPLIVLLPYVSGDRLGVLDKSAIIATTLVLAGLTKTLVEDRFRLPHWGRPLYKPFLLGAALMAVVVVAATAQLVEVARAEATPAAVANSSHETTQACFGAEALAPTGDDCPPTVRGPLTPTPLQATNDRSLIYASVSGKRDCRADRPTYSLVTCHFGNQHGSVKVALVGNSHAAQFLPPLITIADAYDWSITTYVASGCPLNFNEPDKPSGGEESPCVKWAHQATRAVTTGDYDLVVMANRTGKAVAGQNIAAYRDGYERVLDRLTAAGASIVVIRDTPYPGKMNVPDCLASHQGQYLKCVGELSDWLPIDPTIGAVAQLDDTRVQVLDLTRYICQPKICAGAVGGVTAYFDNSHLTATYARTLAPYMAPTLTSALLTADR